MDPLRYLRGSDGIAHRSVLIAEGATRHRLRAAVEQGALIRVRRDWLALPDCAQPLLDAVEAGGRLACVSAAVQRGFWTMDDGRLHIAVPATASRLTTPAACTVHWDGEPASIRAPIESVPRMLRHIAACLARDLAVATVDSVLNKRVIHRDELSQLAASAGGRLAAVVALADGRADSGAESILRVRLGSLGIVLRPQAVVDGHRVDGLIGGRLVIQLDGHRFHSDRRQREMDLEQDARLQLQGMNVLRFPSRAVVERWDYVRHVVTTAVAQGQHLHPLQFPGRSGFTGRSSI